MSEGYTPFKMKGPSLYRSSPGKQVKDNSLKDLYEKADPYAGETNIQRDVRNIKRKVSNVAQDIKGKKKMGTTEDEFQKKEMEKWDAQDKILDKKSKAIIANQRTERDRKKESSKQRNIKDRQITKSSNNRDADAFSPEYLGTD